MSNQAVQPKYLHNHSQVKFPLKKTLAAMLTALGLLGEPAQAAPVNWNAASGSWDVAGNWDPGIPTPPDDVTISVVGVQTITHSTGDDTINTLTNNANANLVINGGSSLSISSGGTNAGTIQAGGASSGTLNLNGEVLTNTGGILNADVGGVINLNSVSVAGGSLNSAGTGKFVANASGANFLNGVTLGGTLDLATSQGYERITNGLTLNNGNINVNNSSILTLENTAGLSGTGTIALGATSTSNLLNLEGTGTSTIGAGILIHGEKGTIGGQSFVGGIHDLVNNGTISADVSGGAIYLTPTGGTTNNATLSAQNGGTLVLNSAVTNVGSGHIDAIGTGSQVVQNGISITGGTINTSGGGDLVASNNSNNFLNDATLNGVINLTSGVERVGGNSGLTMMTGSAINLNNNSILTLEGNAGLSGTGTIALGTNSNYLNLEGTGTSTVGAGILIHGQNGTIG